MKLRTLALALGLALVPASAAQATDYNVTMGGATLKHEWDGGPGVSVIGDSSMDSAADCGPGHDCDNVLIKTDEAGGLQIAIAGTNDTNIDTDLYLFESDASGKKGKALGASESFSPDDAVATRAKAGGFYLAIISYRTALAATYKGTITLKPTAVTTPVPGVTAPGTDAAPGVTLGKIPAKKVKKFSGTASDDKGVKQVEFALFAQKGKKCQPLTAKGKFGKAGSCTAPTWLIAKGTTSWSYTLKSALKKGSYLVAVRSTDSAGAKSQLLYKSFKAR